MKPVYKRGSKVDLDSNTMGSNGVRFVRKMENNPALKQDETFRLPKNSNGKYKQSRIVDIYDAKTGRAIEVKNSSFDKIGIKADIRKQIDADIRKQIAADVYLRSKNPNKYKPEWHFLKPPTDGLMQLLEVNKIPYVIYGR